MKLSDAMLQADTIRPNNVIDEMKKQWLNGLEAEIAEFMGVEVPVWNPEDDPELLMPDPFSNIYPLYLCPYIDWVQEESDLYQIDTIMANKALDDAKGWWIRNNNPSNSADGDGSGSKAQYITGVFF